VASVDWLWNACSWRRIRAVSSFSEADWTLELSVVEVDVSVLEDALVEAVVAGVDKAIFVPSA